MAARGVIPEPHPTRTAAVSPQQVGGDPALIDKHVLPRIVERQPLVPASPLSGNVRPALFVGVNRFF